MIRVSVAERTKLSVLIGSRAFRSLAGHLNAQALLRWPFTAAVKTDRIVIAPQDLRTADATLAAEIYAGRFAFAGKVVVCDRRSPFEMGPPSDEWAVQLHGFGWLRHLRASDSAITRANGRALVDDWIAQQNAVGKLAWRADVLSRRILSWLCQAPLLLKDADAQFYRRFARSLTRQVRYLRRTADDACDGVARLQALTALNYVALCMQGQSGHLRAAMRGLGNELVRQVLPDGGHISRNPGALIDILLDLLPLRQVFAAHNLQPPQALLNAIDRMMPMLRFFRHGDGNFAHFNGMGPTPPDLLATVLAYDDARGAPLSNAPHSGYARIEAGATIVLADAGRPPPIGVSQEAHAGCLSFELSCKRNRIVINCGLPATGRENWRQVARATAAHSTMTLADTSSCRFLESGSFRKLLCGIPIIGGPRHVKALREQDDEAIVLRASHDGYARAFHLVHERVLNLASDGNSLDGEDIFSAAQGGSLPRTSDEFAIRFHLHPAVKASRLADGHGAFLVLPDRDVWTFNAYENDVEIEESVYLAGADGPRRTAQIVIYGRAHERPRVHWTFLHMPPLPAGGRHPRPDEPELPL